LHGGGIKVWGEIGRGSNFVLTLPRVHGVGIVEPAISEKPLS
jgi:hypothetical protein